MDGARSRPGRQIDFNVPGPVYGVDLDSIYHMRITALMLTIVYLSH